MPATAQVQGAPASLGALPYLVLTLVWAVLHLRLGLTPQGFLSTGALVDTDSWMRVQRIQDLAQGGGWYNEVTPRLGAPDGLSLHWTRPLDLLVLLPARLASLALPGLSLRSAIFLIAAAICPLLHLAAAAAAVRAARAVWPAEGFTIAPLLAGVLVLSQPAALGYSLLGRADHHTLILLAGLLALGEAARAVRGDGPPAAWRAGAFAAAGVWVSPEALLFAAPILAGFGLLWVMPGGAEMPAQGRRAALGFTLVILLAILVELPPGRWLDGAYDKVSAQHAAMGLLAAGGFALAGRLRLGLAGRLLAGAAIAALALGLLLAVWPGALRGATAGSDAAAAALLLPHVQEMQPFDPGTLAGWTSLVILIGASLAAPLAMALAIPFPWASPGAGTAWGQPDQWRVAVPVGLTFLVCLGATLLHRRFALDLAAPGCLLAAGLPLLALRAAATPRRRAGLALLALSAIALPAPLAGLLGPAAAEDFGPGCDVPAVVEALAAARPPLGDPILMANDINLGPELAWRSGYRLIAGPYHRGGAALADTLGVFRAADLAAAEAIAARRQLGFVLLCPTSEAPPPGSLAALLRAGTPPPWLEPLASPGEARLFRRRDD